MAAISMFHPFPDSVSPRELVRLVVHQELDYLPLLLPGVAHLRRLEILIRVIVVAPNFLWIEVKVRNFSSLRLSGNLRPLLDTEQDTEGVVVEIDGAFVRSVVDEVWEETAFLDAVLNVLVIKNVQVPRKKQGVNYICL